MIHFVDNADFVDFEYRSYYYSIMSLLFLRGEFSMENMKMRKHQNSMVCAI